MANYVLKDEKDDCYLVAQWFGYSLVSLAQNLIYDGKAQNIRQYIEKITDKKEIFEFIFSNMGFSSHYIEDSKFYLDYTKYSREEYKKRDKSEVSDYEEQDRKEKEERFPIFESYFEDSRVEFKTKLYSIPYLLDGKQLGFRKIEQLWYVVENGEMKEYRLSTKGLICYLNNDGNYTHIEPDLFNNGLETPHVEKERVEDKKLSVPDMFAEAHNRMIEDALEIGILQQKE